MVGPGLQSFTEYRMGKSAKKGFEHLTRLITLLWKFMTLSMRSYCMIVIFTGNFAEGPGIQYIHAVCSLDNLSAAMYVPVFITTANARKTGPLGIKWGCLECQPLFTGKQHSTEITVTFNEDLMVGKCL